VLEKPSLEEKYPPMCHHIRHCLWTYRSMEDEVGVHTSQHLIWIILTLVLTPTRFLNISGVFIIHCFHSKQTFVLFLENSLNTPSNAAIFFKK
jgi:hypothetical protein